MLLLDTLNRPLQDLRISVIDRCNFRCPYCMPENELKHYAFLKEKEWLSFDEIERLVRIFVELGVRKVRLTGGEPLLRPGLTKLIERLSKIEKIEDLALTTNGSLLSKYAHDLKKSGLKRLTVSLDSLDARIFKHMSGQKGELSSVLDGIKLAEQAGFKSIKINVVVQKGVNDQSIIPMIEHFKNTAHVLRFIEYMDVGNCNHWQNKYVVPTKDIVGLIQKKHSLEKVGSDYHGEVAERYQFSDGSGEIGFISSVSQPFCGSCTRLRLSTEGKIYTCLFASNGKDIKEPLRAQASDETLKGILKELWLSRQDRYSEQRAELKPNALPKVEMFQVGG
jgi:cyclic pyranopterin phosphate synthase